MARQSKLAGGAAPVVDDYPPFPGFDPTGLKLLKDLKKNNTREWLTDERKEILRDHLTEPMKCLLAELRRTFVEEGIPFSPDPSRGMFRIYRDIRFSKDKRPFKTHIGAAIPFDGESREGVGNYIHIEPGKCFYGGGAYLVDSTGLKRLRHAIDRDPAALRAILERVEASFGPLQGEQLKRAPAGFAEDHPAIDLLRYKQMWVSIEFPDSLAGSRELVDWIVMKTKESTEFIRFLYDAVKG
jgi:uncharacterized protein (TIGR02453 family)